MPNPASAWRAVTWRVLRWAERERSHGQALKDSEEKRRSLEARAAAAKQASPAKSEGGRRSVDARRSSIGSEQDRRLQRLEETEARVQGLEAAKRRRSAILHWQRAGQALA